jgi:hypothetical protein
VRTETLRVHDDRGSVVLEFLAFGMLLQVLVLMWLINISNLQGQQIAAESVARHSLRAFVLTGTQPQITGQQILNDFGIKVQPRLKFTCEPDCDSPGSVLRLQVAVGSANAQAVAVR